MASTVAGDAITKPVIQLMKAVIRKEDDRQILHRDLRGMETLLLYTDIFFRYQQKDPPEMVKTWLHLLQSSLTEANRLFDRSRPRQSCLDCVVCNPGRLSKEIRVWNALFDQLFHGFLSDLIQHIALSGNTMISVAVDPVMELLKDVIKEEDNRQILQTDLRRMESLLRDFSTLIQPQKKTLREIMLTWLPLLINSLIEAKSLLNSSAPRQSFLDRLSKEIREWTASFNKIYHDFQSSLSMLVTSLQFLSSNPLHIEEKAKEPAVIQTPLSRDEAWMLFRRVAFKEDQVSMDIEDRASKIAEQCRGLPLAINVVAAAMIGQRSLHEWDICLSSIQNVDPCFPATDSGLDAEMYAALRFSYDALPNSDVKKCFLYCALYQEDEEIDTLELVQMWIGEGVVKSKQGTYLMDMAVGRKYLKLLVDRCLFQTVKERTNVFRQKTIRVQSAIRDMAIYIGQKEEKCLFMASDKYQRNFSEVPDENCRRISLASNFNEDLPTQLRCPQLAILTLKNNRYLKDLPSDFVLSVTSLRVLNLSGCTGIISVPTSIDELRMLEFLSLSELPIRELPKEICRLSKLQFLDLSHCADLESLPSEIGEIQNLKCLNLERCDSLKMIPHEISELTSLSRLVLSSTRLSMKTEAAASMWSLKGLKNMTELSVWMGWGQQVKDGIMGTWSEMRHLKLSHSGSDKDLPGIMGTWSEMRHLKLSHSGSDKDLPEDMKSMKKLQSFMLLGYDGCHCLPNCCKFERLEMVSLDWCRNIRDLSPLEWMPNLKLLKLRRCNGLRELGIGSRGGYQRLQKLVLKDLWRLKSLGGASNTQGLWDERTLPNLRVLKIINCQSLKRFPTGMEKLPNLCTLMGFSEWWESIRWEDNSMKIKLQSIFENNKKVMASTVAGYAITNPVIELMEDVISREDDGQILHRDLRSMQTLLLDTDIFFRYQQKDPPETVKIWLQLLQNSLREANYLFYRSRPGQSCLDCVVCKSGRLSKEIRDWNALFDHLYRGFQSELSQHLEYQIQR